MSTGCERALQRERMEMGDDDDVSLGSEEQTAATDSSMAMATSSSPLRCNAPQNISTTSVPQCPDSPISRYRRENDPSPAFSSSDDDEKKVDDEYDNSLDSAIAREIQAARRRANSCCNSSIISDVARRDERVQHLVDKAINNPRGLSYMRTAVQETCYSPVQKPFDYFPSATTPDQVPAMPISPKAQELEPLLVVPKPLSMVAQRRSASVSKLDTMTQQTIRVGAYTSGQKANRFVRRSLNENDLKSIVSSLLDEDSANLLGLKSAEDDEDDDGDDYDAVPAVSSHSSNPLLPTDVSQAEQFATKAVESESDPHTELRIHTGMAFEHFQGENANDLRPRISDGDDLVRRTRSPGAFDPEEDEDEARRAAHFAETVQFASDEYSKVERSYSNVTELSVTESEVGSLDGLPLKLRQQWIQEESRGENIMQNLDGIPRKRSSNNNTQLPLLSSRSDTSRASTPGTGTRRRKKKASEKPSSLFDGWFSNFFGTIGDIPEEDEGDGDNDDDDEPRPRRSRWNDDDTFAILGCANIIHTQRDETRVAPVIPSSLIRVACQAGPPMYADTIHAPQVDPRMQSWIQNHFGVRGRPAMDGTFNLGTSRAVIVHEIVRGNWTWCTAWSPDGSLLAVATENHHLAIVDTTNSAVWRVRHDRKISGPAKNGTTHSIRSIAWGKHYIAIGGTGNAVSILAPHEPYPIVHTILDTGFVGSLSWKADSTDLAFASRAGKAVVVRIQKGGRQEGKHSIESHTLHEIHRKGWVNSVAFSPSGRCLAIGVAGGHLLVYNYLDELNLPLEVTLIKSFMLEDSVIAVQWSSDGRWLYAGGEDFRVTVVETRYWEIVHRVKRDRWVQCISSSHSGSHVAVGGVSAEISLLDVENGWDSVMGIELNGLVPLSASWHPEDQYLSLTGQSNSILVVETTNARHVQGHHLHSCAKILATEFSPDGRMAIVGNSSGVVTFYRLSGSTFETAYELVVMMNDRLSVQWSLNGVYIAIASQGGLIIVGKRVDRQHDKSVPSKVAGFAVQKVVREIKDLNAVSIDFESQYVAVSGNGTWVLDASADFRVVCEWPSGTIHANAWSPDGRWFATIGQEKILTIYDTSDLRVDRWRAVFSVACDDVGRALAWSPMIVGGLLYLAYGGDAKKVTIMEVRSQEGTWETVLRIPRAATIHALDWSTDGLLAVAIGNGTVSIVDLAYLQLGIPVNEKDYSWQRQALTCFTEIRRNRGKNAMQTVRWIPSAPGSDSLLAVGGTDGEVEIVDLTERSRCKGYARSSN